MFELTCNDFRATAISPFISKVFENSIIDRFGSFFTTSDNQFGFKRDSAVTMLFVQFKTLWMVTSRVAEQRIFVL